jgi:hypothetical protein
MIGMASMGPRTRHCRRRGCACSHEVCDRGWIDREHGTTPCIGCREELAVAILPAASREELRHALAEHRGGRLPASV